MMDTDEILAIFDRDGRRIGVKPRSVVHQNHDWHWLAFVWAARLDGKGRCRFLLQLRGRLHDPHHGHVDALSGGHIGADETHLEGALRECREETGLKLNESDVVYLGGRTVDCLTGICRRVVEHFYLCRRIVMLSDLDFGDDVTGFVEVDLAEFVDLIDGRCASVPALVRHIETGDAIFEDQIAKYHVRSYSEEILDGFRLSMRAIERYLHTGVVDRSVWQ
jgi:8-oxo-dGTP pyrophosphatase MutT (NUDIX family)